MQNTDDDDGGDDDDDDHDDDRAIMRDSSRPLEVLLFVCEPRAAANCNKLRARAYQRHVATTAASTAAGAAGENKTCSSPPATFGATDHGGDCGGDGRDGGDGGDGAVCKVCVSPSIGRSAVPSDD